MSGITALSIMDLQHGNGNIYHNDTQQYDFNSKCRFDEYHLEVLHFY